MIELFKEWNINRVNFFQMLLNEYGIATTIKNQQVANSGITSIPLPDFYPVLCILNDDDYEQAVDIIQKQLQTETNPSQDIKCPKCSELNPSNFDVCWSCGTALEK